MTHRFFRLHINGYSSTNCRPFCKMKRAYDRIEKMIKNNLVCLFVLGIVLDQFSDILDEGSTTKRRCVATYHRSSFDTFMERHVIENQNINKLLRMSRQSFDNLVLLLKDSLSVDETQAARRGGAVSPEFCLFITIRYLAGARYQDICEMCNVSRTAVYAAIEKTMVAIVDHPELALKFPKTEAECQVVADGFLSISSNQAIGNCVGAIDGFLMPIKVPTAKEVGNVTAYYSGHYARYGINIQAICDSHCRFTFISASAPGSVNDRVAYEHCKVDKLVEDLPSDYALIADAAYAPSEQCLPMFYGSSRKNNARNDNYNYYASQLRIRIEMAFGMMTRKWLILDSPVKTNFNKSILMIYCIARLHNYCINQRLMRNGTINVNVRDVNVNPTVQMNNIGNPIATNDPNEYRSRGQSFNREMIANELQQRGLVRQTQRLNK